MRRPKVCTEWMSMELRTLDLFAGAGGLTQGFHMGGSPVTTLRAVEIDGDAARTFNANHGADIAVATSIEDWLETDEPERLGHDGLNVIVGGPPCQGFSALGLQDINDERNTLWRQYAESIRRTEATYFIVENVPQFLKSSEIHALRNEILEGSLKDWDVRAYNLNAADFGAPQVRRRAVLLGWRRDMPEFRPPEPTHDRLSRGGRSSWLTVRQAFSGGLGFRPIPHMALKGWPKSTKDSGTGFLRTLDLHVDRNYQQISRDRFAAIPPGGNRFDLPDELLSPCWRKHTSGSGDVMGRLHWDRPSVTVRTEFFKPEKGRYIHPTENRAITHWEAARLQGFPDDYRWNGSRTSIARQIGNAVPIPLGAALAGQLARILKDEPISPETALTPKPVVLDAPGFAGNRYIKSLFGASNH